MPQGFVQLDPKTLVAWSTVVDAPTSRPLVAGGVDETLADVERARLEARGHTFADDQDAAEFVSFNRAGPNELPLTLDALIRSVRGLLPDDRVTPDDIEPYTTTHAVAEGHPLYGRVFWVPFAPDDRPETLDGVTSHDQVEARVRR